jgi:hypothetical protein
MAIHRAVVHSDGRDHYTGEPLDWSLVGQYSNAESKAKKRHYKATLALLPSIDHVGDGLGEADFKLCAWRTNDAKSGLSFARQLHLPTASGAVLDHLRATKPELPILKLHLEEVSAATRAGRALFPFSSSHLYRPSLIMSISLIAPV